MNNNTNSSADEIRKYKELLDQGVISKEEFEELKRKCLAMNDMPANIPVNTRSELSTGQKILAVAAVLTLALAVFVGSRAGWFDSFFDSLIHPSKISTTATTDSETNEDMATKLNSMAQTVYSGVKAGTIKNGDVDGFGNTITWAANAGDEAVLRTKAAEAVTIKNLMEYCHSTDDLQGLYYRKKNGTWDGIVYSESEPTDSDLRPLTEYVTLGDLYYVALY